MFFLTAVDFVNAVIMLPKYVVLSILLRLHTFSDGFINVISNKASS